MEIWRRHSEAILEEIVEDEDEDEEDEDYGAPVARYVLKDPEDHDEHGSSEAAAMVS
jgi:hypothetical protein